MANTFKILTEKSEALFAAIRNGATYKAACECSNISLGQLKYWRKSARSLEIQVDNGEVTLEDLREDQRQLLAFFTEYKKAVHEGELRDLQVITDAAKGGLTYTEVKIEQRPQFNPDTRQFEIIELKTTTEKVMLPDWRAAAWRRERLQKKRFGKYLHVDGEMKMTPLEQIILEREKERGIVRKKHNP